jgi:type I restriction enzyme S subunit
MSFALSKAVDPEKVFLRPFSDLAERWDPEFHRPYYRRRDSELSAGTFPITALGRLRVRVFQGVGQNLVEKSSTQLLKVKNITPEGEIDYSEIEPVADVPTFKLLQHGDIISPFIGAAIRKYKFARYTGAEAAFTVDNNTGVIRLEDEQLNSEFMHVFCQTDLIRWQIDKLIGGGGVPFLGAGNVRKFRIPLPPEDIQKSIVTAFHKSEKQRTEAEEKVNQLLASIDELLLKELGITPKPAPPNMVKNRIFRRAFSAVTGNRLDPLYHHGDMFHFVRAAKCQLAPLGNCVTTFLTGFAAGRNDQADEEGGIIQIRPTNLSDDRELVFRRNVYIARAELKERPLDVLQRREVLFNNTNSQEQVGKTTFFDLAGEFFCSNHITRIATDDSQLDPQFLGYVLNLYQRQQVFFKLATNWNNQSGVGVDVLEKIPIPLPDLKQQEQIVARLEKARAAAEALRRRAAAELSAAKKEIEAMILGGTKSSCP